jgi:hypothetical protein
VRNECRKPGPGLSSDRVGFLGGFARFLEKLAFGADPVFERVAGGAVALKIDFIGALRDLLLRGKFFGGGGFTFR